MSTVAALVPVKAHSERLEGKNNLLFAGKPLYHVILETLSSTPFVSSIIVDTDSLAVAEEAADLFPKVEIVIRPQHLIGGHITSNDIIAHDIRQSDEEHFIQMFCSSPLVSVKTLEAALRFYFSSLPNHDSLFSVSRFHSRFYNEQNQLVNAGAESTVLSQETSPLFQENGAFYIFSRTSYLNAGNKRIGKSPQQYELNKVESMKIEYADDFELAEVLYSIREQFTFL